MQCLLDCGQECLSLESGVGRDYEATNLVCLQPVGNWKNQHLRVTLTEGRGKGREKKHLCACLKCQDVD